MTIRTCTVLAGYAAAGTLAGIGALHGYWATGGRWPGTESRTLAETVVGPAGTKMPTTPMIVGVAVLLEVAALVLLGRLGIWGRRLPQWIFRWGTIGLAAVLVLRGSVGMVTSLADGRSSPYTQLDVALYSPLCLGLGAACAAVARGR